eukprot:3346685-Rhodomonas_salina.1
MLRAIQLCLHAICTTTFAPSPEIKYEDTLSPHISHQGGTGVRATEQSNGAGPGSVLKRYRLLNCGTTLLYCAVLLRYHAVMYCAVLLWP